MIEHSQRFLGSEVPPRPAEQAFFHVIPVPLEATVSYGKGTANGPQAILEASDQLELFDGEGCPGELGIFTHPPVDCQGSMPEVLARVSAATRAVLNVGGAGAGGGRATPNAGDAGIRVPVPVLLGGEHSLTFGALKALKERYGVFGIVQFDAHADLRDEYEGTPWSHACVMRRAVADLGLPLVQVGNRAFSLEEKEARERYHVTAWDAPYLARYGARYGAGNGVPAALMPPDFPDTIFISFDVDGLDPSVIAETGTPVPGGLGWYQALDLAAKAVEGRTVVGFDVVELAPRPGRPASDFAAARLVYALMGLAAR